MQRLSGSRIAADQDLTLGALDPCPADPVQAEFPARLGKGLA